MLLRGPLASHSSPQTACREPDGNQPAQPGVPYTAPADAGSAADSAELGAFGTAAGEGRAWPRAEEPDGILQDVGE